ncbi:MAG: dienelactone hydrolase family protein [Bryobacteraceae bacterium]
MTRRECCALVAGVVPGAGQTIDDEIRRQAANPPLALAFRGGSAEQARTWQHEFRARLDASLGDYAPPRSWETVRQRSYEFADHRREELVLRASGFPDLPVHLLLPKQPGKRPAVLALHGHGPFGHDAVAGLDHTPARQKDIASARYDYGRELARRGYVVAAPCFTPFGERLGDRAAYGREDPCAVTFVRLQLFGKVLMSENLRDALWALELLASCAEVDPERLGCVGLSLGGRMTMLTSAVSPRVKVAVASGALNVMQERVRARYSCGAQVIPGLLRYGDVPEIASLIAPRPCLWEVGQRDGLMVKDWIEPSLARMKRAWAAFGAESELMVDSFDGGHRWNGEKAYPLLEKVLRP